MRKPHLCSVCLHQWRVPQFALKHPCNPPPPPGETVTGQPPPPMGDHAENIGWNCLWRGHPVLPTDHLMPMGDRRVLRWEISRGGTTSCGHLAISGRHGCLGNFLVTRAALSHIGVIIW